MSGTITSRDRIITMAMIGNIFQEQESLRNRAETAKTRLDALIESGAVTELSSELFSAIKAVNDAFEGIGLTEEVVAAFELALKKFVSNMDNTRPALKTFTNILDSIREAARLIDSGERKKVRIAVHSKTEQDTSLKFLFEEMRWHQVPRGISFFIVSERDKQRLPRLTIMP